MKSSVIIIIALIMYSNILFGQAIVDSGYVKIKKLNLYYEVYGEGEPVVFLNGGPGFSSEGYKKYADLLSDHYMVILFDQRGTGRSAMKSKRIYMKSMVKDIDLLRQHLNIEKWNVFGHSFGGLYAMNYASKFPDNITKLILSASPGYSLRFGNFQQFPEVDVSNYTVPELKVMLEIKDELEKENPDQRKVGALKGLLKARFYTQFPKNYEQVINWFRKYSKRSGLKFFNKISRDYMKKKLENYNNPVLIIHGLNDFINIQHPKENHELFPNSQLKFIEQSGHMMIIDQPELYATTILDFLN